MTCTHSRETSRWVEDIRWALEKDFAEIPKDEHGFSQGTFRVTITWSEE